MYPPNPQYEPFFISDTQDEMETLRDDTVQQDHHTKKFYPRTLRLSNSLPTFPSTARRNSCSASVQNWKRGLVQNNHSKTTGVSSSRKDPLRHHAKLAEHLQPPPPTTRTSLHRLRTRSLERKPKEYRSLSLTGSNSTHHRKTFSYNGLPGSTASSENGERHLVGFHTHIPIERTALSVLPPSRKPSIDWTQAGNVTPISRPTVDSDHSSSSASPQSTLATSVNSNGTPPRPRYQPRPLLLSTFGTSKLTYTPSDYNNRTSRNDHTNSSALVSTDQPLVQTLDQQVLNNRLISLKKLDQVQQIRQEKIHANEAKKLRKRIREDELKAISSRVDRGVSGSSSNGEGGRSNNNIRCIPEADEDECWCWLSCSDAEEEEGGGGGGSQDESAEEMAVVWRASLDVGRRVSKDRKALGRGHGIRLSPKTPRSTATSPQKSTSTSSPGFPNNSQLLGTPWALGALHSLMPHHLITSICKRSRKSVLNPSRSFASAPFLFGSGLISGFIFSVLSSTLFWKLPSFLQRRLIPISTNGIGFFFHFIFPHADHHFYSAPLHFLHSSSIGTSLGLYTQWCKL